MVTNTLITNIPIKQRKKMFLNFNRPTPLEEYTFENISFLLKRDDLISQLFSGNKARKIDYYWHNFPSHINTIVSYGSIQSNAMLSLARFAALKRLNFRYYANHIPSFLRENPHGNLLLALKEGMELKEGYSNLIINENELLIKEGIATQEAYFGVEKLAQELIEQVGKGEYQVFLPSGTGTTALFLSKALQKLGVTHFKVYTTACVGSSEYLREQWQELESNESYYPIIVETKKRYHFGRLYREFYQIWLELHKATGVEFELLYDPKGWLAILENREIFTNLLYIHQGGELGNISMLARYKRKYGENI